MLNFINGAIMYDQINGISGNAVKCSTKSNYYVGRNEKERTYFSQPEWK